MIAVNRRGLLLSLGLGCLLVAASAGAERTWRLPRPVAAYSVELEDADGLPLPTFRHEGRTFVLGDLGQRYVIRIANPTGERVEAVVSVDGRDAVSGNVGDYRSQRGYIVPAYGSITVDGFRQSVERVASFRFSSPQQSYSARRGTPENVGVIGVAVFRERRALARPEPRPFPRRSAAESESAEARRDPRAQAPASAAPEDASAARSKRGRADAAVRAPSHLGTEYGESRESSVREVSFTRRSHEPERLLTLRYDDALGLERRGIQVARLWPYGRDIPPEPFPESRFAPPPR